jgi:hypothetical protein
MICRKVDQVMGVRWAFGGHLVGFCGGGLRGRSGGLVFFYSLEGWVAR